MEAGGLNQFLERELDGESLASLHLLQHTLIDLQFLGLLLNCQTTFPHHIQVKIVLPAIDPPSLEGVMDRFSVERFGFVLPNPLDALENLV